MAIHGTADVGGAQCPKDVAPVNGAGTLEIQRCTAAVGVEEPRVALRLEQAMGKRRDDAVTTRPRGAIKPERTKCNEAAPAEFRDRP